MDESSAKFSELPTHEIVRAVGQLAVQGGLFLIAVSSVLKHIGNLPEIPMASPTGSGIPNTNTNSSQPREKGYFD